MTGTTTCLNCGNAFTGNYCNNCGEKVLHDHDKTIAHFLEDGVHFITHFEGKFFTTLKTIFRWPGKLSVDYCKGVRQPYFKPLSFFLMIVILYLLFPRFQGLNMTLAGHMGQGPTYGAYATAKVEQYLQHHPGTTIQQLAEKFAKKSEKTSKILLFIIIPLTALPLWLMTFKRRKYYYEHLVLSTEINAFFLLFGFLLFPLILSGWDMLGHWLKIPGYDFADKWLGIVAYTVFAIFTATALRRFYQYKWKYNLVILLLMLAIHILIIYFVYKFILFITVFALL
jgi:hypothetical protein